MKFSVPQRYSEPPEPCAVGNVYAAKGGRKTSYWIVIALFNNMAHCVGVNDDGVITATTSYGAHVFEGCAGLGHSDGRTVLGRVENLDNLTFDIIFAKER